MLSPCVSPLRASLWLQGQADSPSILPCHIPSQLAMPGGTWLSSPLLRRVVFCCCLVLALLLLLTSKPGRPCEPASSSGSGTLRHAGLVTPALHSCRAVWTGRKTPSEARLLLPKWETLFRIPLQAKWLQTHLYFTSFSLCGPLLSSVTVSFCPPDPDVFIFRERRSHEAELFITPARRALGPGGESRLAGVTPLP